jgi:arylsulfatase A-like enzyme
MVIALSALLLAGAAAHAADRKPNFIIILADDLGYGDLSINGGWIPAPQLDRLAREGLRFTDFHASGNVCSPTRCGLMTGRYQQRAGIPSVVYADPAHKLHKDGLQPNEVTLPSLLKQAGYTTGIFGKWHLGYDVSYNPTRRGFDEFIGYVSGNVDYISHVDGAGRLDWWHNEQIHDEPGYTTHLLTRHAIEFLEKHTDRPFLLYLPFEPPHTPYQAPGDPALRQVGEAEKGGDGDGGPTTGSGKKKAGGKKKTGNDVKQTYAAMVQEMDKGIGR